MLEEIEYNHVFEPLASGSTDISIGVDCSTLIEGLDVTQTKFTEIIPVEVNFPECPDSMTVAPKPIIVSYHDLESYLPRTYVVRPVINGVAQPGIRVDSPLLEVNIEYSDFTDYLVSEGINPATADSRLSEFNDLTLFTGTGNQLLFDVSDSYDGDAFEALFAGTDGEPLILDVNFTYTGRGCSDSVRASQQIEFYNNSNMMPQCQYFLTDEDAVMYFRNNGEEKVEVYSICDGVRSDVSPERISLELFQSTADPSSFVIKENNGAECQNDVAQSNSPCFTVTEAGTYVLDVLVDDAKVAEYVVSAECAFARISINDNELLANSLSDDVEISAITTDDNVERGKVLLKGMSFTLDEIEIECISDDVCPAIDADMNEIYFDLLEFSSDEYLITDYQGIKNDVGVSTCTLPGVVDVQTSLITVAFDADALSFCDSELTHTSAFYLPVFHKRDMTCSDTNTDYTIDLRGEWIKKRLIAYSFTLGTDAEIGNTIGHTKWNLLSQPRYTDNMTRYMSAVFDSVQLRNFVTVFDDSFVETWNSVVEMGDSEDALLSNYVNKLNSFKYALHEIDPEHYYGMMQSTESDEYVQNYAKIFLSAQDQLTMRDDYLPDHNTDSIHFYEIAKNREWDVGSRTVWTTTMPFFEPHFRYICHKYISEAAIDETLQASAESACMDILLQSMFDPGMYFDSTDGEVTICPLDADKEDMACCTEHGSAVYKGECYPLDGAKIDLDKDGILEMNQ